MRETPDFRFKNSCLLIFLSVIFLIPSFLFAEPVSQTEPEIKIKVLSQAVLRFGKFSAGSTGVARITINPITKRKTIVGGISVGSSYYGPAKFKVTGEPGRYFLVTLPNKTQYVSNFTVYIPSDQISERFGLQNNEEGIFGYFDKTGRATIFVGGTLLVSSGSKKYGEAFSISVEYA